MRLAFLMLLGVALAACAATRPEADLPPQYAAAPAILGAGLDVDAGPALPTRDPALDLLLKDVVSTFRRHDWRGLAATLDEADYAQQFAFMRQGRRSPEAAVAQILEESFGLGTAGNEVYPPVLAPNEQPFAGLDRVRAVALESAEAAGEGVWQVEGRVRLDDRTSRRLSFTVTRTGDAYRVAVPQG